jgi:hypothetical protein
MSSLSVASGSQSSHGGSQDSVDSRFNRRLLLPWNELLTYRCDCVAIIHTWELDGNDSTGRRFFKCSDLDPDFMVHNFNF